MKISIEIECTTIGEVKSHLTCLISQIKKHQKSFSMPDDDELATGTHITDNNCYGIHDLNVVQGRGNIGNKWHKQKEKS